MGSWIFRLESTIPRYEASTSKLTYRPWRSRSSHWRFRLPKRCDWPYETPVHILCRASGYVCWNTVLAQMLTWLRPSQYGTAWTELPCTWYLALVLEHVRREPPIAFYPSIPRKVFVLEKLPCIWYVILLPRERHRVDHVASHPGPSYSEGFARNSRASGSAAALGQCQSKHLRSLMTWGMTVSKIPSRLARRCHHDLLTSMSARAKRPCSPVSLLLYPRSDMEI